MRFQALSIRLAIALALTASVLAGCAAPRGPHSHEAGTGSYGGMGGPQAGMDMHSMCETHRKMMAGKPPAERQAMMDEQMKSMSPEMRGRARQMMENCR